MLTDRQIQAAMKSGGEVVLNDGAGGRGTGSLRLLVRPTRSGPTATWFGFWKVDGRRSKLTLGRYPDLSLKDAREKFAAEVRATLQAGKNPRAHVARMDRPTVEALFKAYVEDMRANGRRSVDEVERALLNAEKSVAEMLGRSRLAGDIEPGDVSGLLSKLYRKGSRVAADRNRAYISAAFNWGIQATHNYTTEARFDWGIKNNPATAVKRDSEASKPRDRTLSPEELATLWRGLDGAGFGLETRSAVRILIACGQRVEETLRADGVDVDLEAGVWRMPADKTKGGRAHEIPLPPVVIPVFRQLIEVHGSGPLFPARTGAADRMNHRAVNRSLARWCERTGAEVFQSRDIRRTWKSRTGDAGIDRFVRDLIQQHAKGDTGSRHYDRTDYLPRMREAMTTWSAWLSGIIERKISTKESNGNG